MAAYIPRDLVANNEDVAYGSQLGATMVNLFVGDEQHHFHVHRDMLCKVPYFDKMFCGAFEETRTSTAFFPDDTVEAFDLLIGWFYSGAVRPLRYNRDPDDLYTFYASWDIVNAYALAEKLCIPELQNALFDTYKNVSSERSCFPLLEHIVRASTKTSDGSGLRRYYCKVFGWVLRCGSTSGTWATEDMAKLLGDRTFALEFATMLRAEGRNPPCNPFLLPNSEFHVH